MLSLLLSYSPAQLHECDHRQSRQRQPQRRKHFGHLGNSGDHIVKVEERRIVLEDEPKLRRRASRSEICEGKLLIRSRRIGRIENHYAVPEHLELNRAEAEGTHGLAPIFSIHKEAQFIAGSNRSRKILAERARPAFTGRPQKCTEISRVRREVVDTSEGSIAALSPAAEIACLKSAVGNDVRYRSRRGMESKTEERNG